MNFRNLFFFYVIMAIPLLCLALLLRTHHVSAKIFVIGLFAYAFLYHPLICGLRLLQNKKIKRKEFFLNFVPFWNQKYFNFLFFNK